MRQLTPGEIANEAIKMFIENLRSQPEGGSLIDKIHSFSILAARNAAIQEVIEGCAATDEDIRP